MVRAAASFTPSTASFAAETPPLLSSAAIAARAIRSRSGSRRNATTTIRQFKPLFGTDRITLTLRGRDSGNMVDFEGTALQLPGVAFKATMTRIAD